MAQFSSTPSIISNTAYHLVRRGQAAIAAYLHFNSGDLAKFLERDAFLCIAQRFADHFFHRSAGLAIYDQVVELYVALLILAPILQRLPLSHKVDWHHGHFLGFFRINGSGRIGRFYFGCREIERRYQPDVLAVNLEALGIHDADMVAVLLDLYRRHAGGSTLKDLLAHQLFDPIMMTSLKQGYELRYGNMFYRLEKAAFENSVDIRTQAVSVADFSIRSLAHLSGRHLEIGITATYVAEFKEHIKRIVTSCSSPEFKIKAIEVRIRDFAEHTRSARSALEQIKDLKNWLATKINGLAGTNEEAKTLPNLLLNLWLQRADSALYIKSPNFFLNPTNCEEKTFRTFFSPYREV